MVNTLTYTLVAHLLTLLAAKEPATATLVFAGDAMMHKGQLAAARQADGSYDFSGYFDAFEDYIASADYAVANLETPLGTSNFTGYPCFNAPGTYADELKSKGFDMLLTANNHTLDRRDKGLCTTIEMLDEKGIDHVGTYRNVAERDTVLPMIRSINGIDIAFLNYTYGTNGITVQGDVVVDYIDRRKMSGDIKRAREAGAELVCAAVHWGDEYVLLPNASQRRLGDYLIEEGVDMVIGGHPHVIQPMEMRTDSTGRKHLLVYSLGNFISDMKKTDTRGGSMLRVHVSRDRVGVAHVDSASYRLVFVEPGAPGRNHHLVDPDSCRSQWRGQASAFSANARRIFGKHNVSVPERK